MGAGQTGPVQESVPGGEATPVQTAPVSRVSAAAQHASDPSPHEAAPAGGHTQLAACGAAEQGGGAAASAVQQAAWEPAQAAQDRMSAMLALVQQQPFSPAAPGELWL